MMSFANKRVVILTNAPLAVTAAQMVITTLVATATLDFRFGDGTLIWVVTVPPLFVFMLCASMVSLEFVSLGAWVVIRNLGPVVTLLLESVMMHSNNFQASPGMVCGAVMVAAGAWVYEAVDIQFSRIGAALVALNLIAAVMERIAQRHLLAVRKVNISTPSLMILNNATGVLLVSIVSFLFAPQDFHRLWTSCNKSGITVAWVALSCTVGVSLSYFGIWLQTLISASSFMVIGAMTKLFLIASGVIFLGDSSSFTSWIGVSLSFAGGAIYSFKLTPSPFSLPKVVSPRAAKTLI